MSSDRHRKLVVRTGCLSCRSNGIPCDLNNQQCQQYSSTKWRSNRSLVRHQHASSYQSANSSNEQRLGIIQLDRTWPGTLREKESLHFFSVISAPELSGFLDTKFWQQLLLQATHSDDAIKHAVAALGASHEYALRRQASRLNTETDGLRPFGIRQCNKAINNLLRPSKGSKEGKLIRALTLSILFASFESLSGNSEAAIPHVIHARKLLETCKKCHFEANIMHDFPVNLDSIKPLVSHYEVQIGSYVYDHEPDRTLEKFDLTTPLEFHTVGEARIPLGQSIAEFGLAIYNFKRQDARHNVEAIAQCKADYVAWLHKWDAAFTTFLDRNRSNFDRRFLDGCRLLKAHQLAASAFVGVAYGQGESAWSAYTPEFRSIIELITTMTENLPKRGMAVLAPQLSYLSSTMGMTEPLYLAATRCTDLTVAHSARELMKKLPLNEGVHSAWRIAFLEKGLCEATGKVYFEEPQARMTQLGVYQPPGAHANTMSA